jgi:transcriptional regulator with XRE-family HTH domain
VAREKGKLQLTREEAGMTREQVVRLLDPPVSVRTLIRWEDGSTPIPYHRMRQLALMYRVKANELTRDFDAVKGERSAQRFRQQESVPDAGETPKSASEGRIRFVEPSAR